MVAPVPSKYKITTPYGKRGPMWSSGHHQGVDYACPVGTDLIAPIDATVVGVGVQGGWGTAFGRFEIILQFVAKRGPLLPARTYYAILAHGSSSYVKIGDKVKAGQVIGKSGAEGNVSGPHLHFEVQTSRFWSKTNDVDPQFVIDYQPPASAKPVAPVATAAVAIPKPGAVKPPVKKAPAKKPAKKPAKAPAKPVKKAPAKKAPVKKAPPKK